MPLPSGSADERASATTPLRRAKSPVMLSGVPTPEHHPMLPYLVDLELQFDPKAFREYDPVELVRYALGASDYWADLAVRWLEQGVPAGDLRPELLAVEEESCRPQSLRHRARRARRTA